MYILMSREVEQGTDVERGGAGNTPSIRTLMWKRVVWGTPPTYIYIDLERDGGAENTPSPYIYINMEGGTSFPRYIQTDT
jgi:hypothetical protein